MNGNSADGNIEEWIGISELNTGYFPGFTHSFSPCWPKSCRPPPYWPVAPRWAARPQWRVAWAADARAVTPWRDRWPRVDSSDAQVCIVSDLRPPERWVDWLPYPRHSERVAEVGNVGGGGEGRERERARDARVIQWVSAMSCLTYRYASWQKAIDTVHRNDETVAIERCQRDGFRACAASVASAAEIACNNANCVNFKCKIYRFVFS